jgi:hypothetical protein
MPVISALRGSTNWRIPVQAVWSIKQDLTSKITNTKRAGGVAREVEHMPSKQAQGPEFKPQYYQKNIYIHIYKRKKKENQSVKELRVLRRKWLRIWDKVLQLVTKGWEKQGCLSFTECLTCIRCFTYDM